LTKAGVLAVGPSRLFWVQGSEELVFNYEGKVVNLN